MDYKHIYFCDLKCGVYTGRCSRDRAGEPEYCTHKHNDGGVIEAMADSGHTDFCGGKSQ